MASLISSAAGLDPLCGRWAGQGFQVSGPPQRQRISGPRRRTESRCGVAMSSDWCGLLGSTQNPLLEDSLYATIEGRYRVRIMRARQVFTATAVGGSETELVEVKPGSPV